MIDLVWYVSMNGSWWNPGQPKLTTLSGLSLGPGWILRSFVSLNQAMASVCTKTCKVPFPAFVEKCREKNKGRQSKICQSL